MKKSESEMAFGERAHLHPMTRPTELRNLNSGSSPLCCRGAESFSSSASTAGLSWPPLQPLDSPNVH
jgi:hypothetical protein